MLSKELLEIICCPKTKQPLQEASDAELEKINSFIKPGKEILETALISADKKIAYPVRQNIPSLLAEEAITLV